jgi:hypothetical protein
VRPHHNSIFFSRVPIIRCPSSGSRASTISRVRALLGARRKNVWSQKKFVEKLQYMHVNLLKRKLVAHPKDWPWSSFSILCNPEARFGAHRSGQLIHSRMAPTNPPSFPLRRTGPLKIQIKGRTTRPLGRISFSLSGFVFLSLAEVKSRQAEAYPTTSHLISPEVLLWARFSNLLPSLQ